VRDRLLIAHSESTNWKRIDGEEDPVVGHRSAELFRRAALPDTDLGQAPLAARVFHHARRLGWLGPRRNRLEADASGRTATTRSLFTPRLRVLVPPGRL
jgi:hypothetical protein